LASGIPGPDERTNAMLAHLLAIFTGFLGPLVIWLVSKDQSTFADHHGKEALNFQLFYLVVGAGLAAVTMLTLGLAILVVFPLLIAIGILFLVWEIQACLAANRGEWFRYPVTIRFIA
jgi:uncharacterized Tic20 family protein